MRGPGQTLLALLLTVVAAVAQVTMFNRIDVLGGYPDVSLVVLVCLGLSMQPGHGAILGFLSGLVLGAVTGFGLGVATCTRAILGFVLGAGRDLDLTGQHASGVAAAATMALQTVLLVVTPPSDFGEYVRGSVVQALLNGILAWPVFAALQRVYRPKVV